MNGVFHMHPPKTGGTSIISALMKHTNFKDKYGHLYKINLYDHINPFNCNIVDEFVTLGIRNPYNRHLSLCQWTNLLGILQTSGATTIEAILKQQHRVSKLSKQELSKIPHRNFLWALQSTLSNWEDQVSSEHNVKLIRFEHLVEDFNSVYPSIELPHIHKKEKFEYQLVVENFYSQEILNKFNEKNQHDFDRYNYKMFLHLDDLYENFQQL